MNRRTRFVATLAKRMPHPEPPNERYLARVRRPPTPTVLGRLVLGPLPRRLRVTDRELELPGGARPVRVYEPWPRTDDRPLPLVVNFHGGGFVFGNLAQTDWLCGHLATRVKAVVVSVSYRLAPEHPAPTPYEDCWAAANWLQRRAGELGADGTRASVMGASAGGNLAALVAIAHRDRCREEADLAPLEHQVLIYPATDLTLSSPSVLELPDAPLLTKDIMDWFGRRYLPQGRPDSISSADPRVSPLFAADHRDLAPALIVAAGHDPLRDDAYRYAEALTEAGVPTRLVNQPEAIHGFISLPTMSADAGETLDEIVATLSGDSPADHVDPAAVSPESSHGGQSNA